MQLIKRLKANYHQHIIFKAMAKSKQKENPQELRIQELDTLLTVKGKTFKCTYVKFSPGIPGLILSMTGKVEGDEKSYWWNQRGQCTTHNPKKGNATRKCEYDINLKQLK